MTGLPIKVEPEYEKAKSKFQGELETYLGNYENEARCDNLLKYPTRCEVISDSH